MAAHVGRVLTSLVVVLGVSHSCAPARQGAATPGTHQLAAASALSVPLTGPVR